MSTCFSSSENDLNYLLMMRDARITRNEKLMYKEHCAELAETS